MLADVTHVTVLVENVDGTKERYTGTFGFEERPDEEFDSGMRWVTIAPPRGNTEVVLPEANAPFHGEQRAVELRSLIEKGPTTVLATGDCRPSTSSRGTS